MTGNKDGAALIGVGVAACAVCCAGPILGVLAAIGLGTAAGVAFFGTFVIVVGAAAVTFVLVRRRRATACAWHPDPPIHERTIAGRDRRTKIRPQSSSAHRSDAR